MQLIPWAATSAAECTTLLQRRASVGALGSVELLRLELVALLQRTGSAAADAHGFFLRASFTPDAAAGSPGGAQPSMSGSVKLHASACRFWRSSRAASLSHFVHAQV